MHKVQGHITHAQGRRQWQRDQQVNQDGFYRFDGSFAMRRGKNWLGWGGVRALGLKLPPPAMSLAPQAVDLHPDISGTPTMTFRTIDMIILIIRLMAIAIN